MLNTQNLQPTCLLYLQLKLNYLIIFRKHTKSFNSIENVFTALLPFLKVSSIELPYESTGLLKRIGNILFLLRQKPRFTHITGHDHYLLWWSFKNTILTVHDIEALNRKKGIKKWIFKKLWFHLPIKNASIVTTVSEFSKKEIASINKHNTPIHVIANPLTLPTSFQTKQFNTLLPRILHIGIKQNKNLARLIKSLSGIKCKLVIIGNENRDLLIELKTHQLEYEFISDITNEELIEEYKKCDIVSLVSTYEGFGLPIVEAQAIGRPIITSNCSSMPEVAGEGALLVDPYSISEIRSGFNKLIANSELRSALIEKGLVNVKRFDPEFIANQYLNLYKNFLSEH
jgi:glycosyltransferase involved in cell wall biosynthesis